jgi:hypothetical protein
MKNNIKKSWFGNVGYWVGAMVALTVQMAQADVIYQKIWGTSGGDYMNSYIEHINSRIPPLRQSQEVG